jgi:methionyl-tRNA formyltransferase
MQMAAGLDTGDILHQSICPISDTDTGETIHDKLAEQGAEDIIIVLEQLINNKLQPKKQDEAKTSYAHKLSKADAHIDWTKPAIEIDRMIRAFNPWPVAFTEYHGKPMKIIMSSVKKTSGSEEPGKVINESTKGVEVATGEGALVVHRLQLPGKKAMDVADFLNGHSLSSVLLGQ